MLQDYWTLKESPFENVADTRFAFLSDQHNEGLSRLIYLVEGHKLGGILVGPYGVGKSMVLELLAEKVRARGDSLYVQMDATPAGTLALANHVLSRLGHATAIYDASAALAVIEHMCNAEQPPFAHLVLAIDEAQLLCDSSTYDFLHLLMNLRCRRAGASGKPALTLILAGHTELTQTIAAEESLRQRMHLLWQLDPLQEHQTAAYIAHRLRIAGGDSHLFDAEAVQAIHRASGGLPRQINTICDLALFIGLAARAKRIAANLVRQAVAEMGLPTPTTPEKPAS